MSAPIRSQAEITTIINKAQNSLADLGYEIIGDAKRGEDMTETSFRDKAYRIILLNAYLQNLLDPNTGELRLYYASTTNQLVLNNLLNALVALSDASSSAGGIPRILSPTGTVVYYPSTSGPTGGGGSSSGGPASPGGVTFQNINVSAPGEIVDVMDATTNDYAFYVIRVRGSGSGEGSRLDIVGVNWRGSVTPVITTYRGDGAGGTVPNTVYYSAEIVDGEMELTCNVPTNGWNVRGTRISFENISFQNAQGPLPSGGTEGQYLRKSSSVDFDAAFASILLNEVTGLAAALNNRLLLAGGTMTGPINMGSNKITSLTDGTDPADAVNKSQLDAVEIKADTAQADIDTHEARTDNPHSVTKSQVGLGNVDNTSDADKPVSTAQQTAIDTKISLALPYGTMLQGNNGNSADALPIGPNGYVLTSNGIFALWALPTVDSGSWVTLTLINSWVAGTVAPAYRKDGLGIVHLRGECTRASDSSTSAFTLPAGNRPLTQEDIGGAAQDSTLAVQSLSISTGGNITGPSVNRMRLGSITFFTT